LFSLPGSPNACRLALEKLIIPELPHLIREVRR
jgi:molybdopterin adenylyltransferase